MPERDSIIKAGVIAGLTALLFPPFYFHGASGARIGLGHAFLLLPPTIGSGPSHGSIDGLGLLAILVGIALVTWGATLVRWRKDKGRQ